MIDDSMKRINLGGKILNTSRDNLYFDMRFMDMALFAFQYTPAEGNRYAGTDGKQIYYYPDFLIDLYQQDVKLSNRLYLHMVLHCIYRHVFRIENRNRRIWDLACDIAVDAITDGLHYSSIKMRIPAMRDSYYRELKQNCKILTADLIYSYIEKQDYLPEKLTAMENQFRLDDHSFWYHNSNDKKTTMQNQNKWEDISNQMQTSMETMEKGAGQENENMLQTIDAENRPRYDYKEFLRKFAVYREDMEVDPDTFDYSFYTYGLSLYGNMPLIEPLEQKEVKKIQDFVIAIDTSYSCSEEQVRNFLQETCQILFTTESFFKKVNIRVIQCDNKIQKDDTIYNEEEMKDYINHLTIQGRGGTDFRPVFEYVNSLIEKNELTNLKGLLYFTDGRGKFPKRQTPYDTAFVFLREDYVDIDVPHWAIKLEI